MVGGLNFDLAERIRSELEVKGFAVLEDSDNLDGNNPENICNKGKYGKGVQIEVSRKLRKKFYEDNSELNRFVGTVRSVLQK